MKLRRSLGLFTLTLYGIGIILGAGIYSLIGIGAGLAGNMLWLSFIVAGTIAAFSAMSYAELSSMFSRSAAEYTYSRNAFKKEWLAFLTEWVMLIGSVVSAAVVALAFGGYLSFLSGANPAVLAVFLIAACSAISYLGIRESAIFNDIGSVIEVAGLVIVIVIGFFFNSHPTHFDPFQVPSGGLFSVLAAAGIVYFAYIGFESMVNLSEEVKDSKRVMPKAIIISLVVCTILYILVSFSSLSLLGWQGLAASEAPLSSAVEQAVPGIDVLISFIALFATGGTVLVILIGASRMLYGISNSGSLPSLFSNVGYRRTPHFAILATGMAAAAFAVFGNLKSIAQLTDLGIFIAYLFVNLSLIALRRSSLRRGFRSLTFRSIPVLAVLGAVSSIVMFSTFGSSVWSIELQIILLGIIVFFVYRLRRRQG
ncbi:MAG: amino acid permease [Candidatus Micrarchaeota archaeon]|nr:amino acid permease [Candidatus Micrarchaeota archaeon]MDE1850089.1 amino acid permease [Candidatus Micrarchaeota archaeon]